jgi:hypothetical protein
MQIPEQLFLVNREYLLGQDFGQDNENVQEHAPTVFDSFVEAYAYAVEWYETFEDHHSDIGWLKSEVMEMRASDRGYAITKRLVSYTSRDGVWTHPIMKQTYGI